MHRLTRIFLSLFLISASAIVAAQSLATIALHEGADRQARRVEGAKKEGTLTLYATTPIEYRNALRPVCTQATPRKKPTARAPRAMVTGESKSQFIGGRDEELGNGN